MKNETKKEKNIGCLEHLFLPMCYLYRNCVELSLKSIWFEETEEDFQIKCKIMLDKKHSIKGMWNKIKPFVIKCSTKPENTDYLNVIEDYCKQIHDFDSDANKFRYPMSNTMQVYFPNNKRFDFIHMGDFFEELINILYNIDSKLNYMNGIKAEMEVEHRAEMLSKQDYY